MSTNHTQGPLARTSEALAEMDQVVRLCRECQRVGEPCAEFDPEVVRRWRLALSGLLSIYAPILAELTALINGCEAHGLFITGPARAAIAAALEQT